MKTSLLWISLCCLAIPASVFAGAGQMPVAPTAAALQAAIDGDWRAAENRARDQYRHPAQTLAMFGIQPGQTVVEITPGGGWYTEILAPYLGAQGHYVGAMVDAGKEPNKNRSAFYAGQTRDLKAKMDADPAHYGKAELREFDPAHPAFGPDGSADVVLTFRNVHNWMMAGSAQAMFDGFFKVLKPGGVLGVVEHRLPADMEDKGGRTGYVSRADIETFAHNAGFMLDGSSEVNANPKDTHDHPAGVWTLPPTLRLKDKDREKYLAIGESDRMTLRFVKPEMAAETRNTDDRSH